jgi:uncharacterized protein
MGQLSTSEGDLVTASAEAAPSRSFWQRRLRQVRAHDTPVPTYAIDSGWALAKGFRPAPIIVFVGAWERAGGSLLAGYRSTVEFAAFEFAFGGAVIRWFGDRGPDGGCADVFIDGQLVETIDVYAPEPETGVIVFERADFDPTVPHKIRVVVRRGARSDALAVVVQRLESVLPLSYPIEIAEARSAEYAVIQRGGKPIPDRGTWTPVATRANAPRSGVSLGRGVLRDAFDRNLTYLRDCLRSPTFADGVGWTQWLPASNEGRMLAGLANSLRWEEHPDLREGVLAIVAGAVARARADGYYDLYPEEDFALEWGLFSERKNYDRVFWTRGMLAAAEVGAAGAAEAVRAMYDWFNRSPWLPSMLLGSNATNGLPGGPIVHLSPVGVAEDLITAIRYYDQDYWLEELTRAEPLAFAYYPGERPHCYSLLGVEAFAHQYLATGDRKYLDVVLGAWKAYRENFLHVGGITTLMERDAACLPKSYEIDGYPLGELCGAVFWVWINQLLQKIDPTNEAYAGEIEDALLGAILGAQDPRGRLRYHAALTGAKHDAQCVSSCCEVTGTHMLARLPELIFSTGDSDVFVHQFFAAAFTVGDSEAYRTIEIASDFPISGAVAIQVHGAPSTFALHVRTPSWSPGPVDFAIEGKRVTTGRPGEYVRIERRWDEGDTVTFDLAPTLRVVRYEGIDQVAGAERGALLFGPTLLALTGHEGEAPRLAAALDDLARGLERLREDALDFSVPGHPELRFVPYFQVQEGQLEVYPVVGA